MTLQIKDTQSLLTWNIDATYVQNGVAHILRVAYYDDGTSEGAASRGVYELINSTFTFAITDFENLGFSRPRLGDVIVHPDDNRQHTIIRFVHSPKYALNFYSVTTKSPSIREDAALTASIYRKSPGVDQYAMRRDDHALLHENVKCTLFTNRRQRIERNDHHVTDNDFVFITEQYYAMQYGDIIMIDDEKYEVISQQSIDVLGELVSTNVRLTR